VKIRSTQQKNSAVARASNGAGRSNYTAWSGGIAALLEKARRQSARSVNAILTATYWEIGRRIVEFVQADENPPVGLVLCSEHDEAVARYSMGNLMNKILAAQYKLNLPGPRTLESEIEKTRRLLESRAKFRNDF
jgi:hypothetical protein